MGVAGERGMWAPPPRGHWVSGGSLSGAVPGAMDLTHATSA